MHLLKHAVTDCDMLHATYKKHNSRYKKDIALFWHAGDLVKKV